MKEGLFYTSVASPDGQTLRCELCKLRCTITPGSRGQCRVRENREGKLYSLSYGNVIALHEDPVEKKPLFHVAPGSIAFSFAAEGCNLFCPWCQNHQISQAGKGNTDPYGRGHAVSPARIVSLALEGGARVMAATYTEPTIFFELALETAALASEQGLINAWVTNGSMAEKPLEAIAPYLQAANVDLKGIDDAKTRSWIGIGATQVLDTIRHMHARGIWVELTTLLVPGFNDTPAEIERIASFIAELDPHIPWHVTRYFPQYKYDAPPTPPETLRLARQLGGEAGLKFIYTGNIAEEGGEDTCCPSCSERIIEREGHGVQHSSITPQGTCPSCGATIPGIAMA